MPSRKMYKMQDGVLDKTGQAGKVILFELLCFTTVGKKLLIHCIVRNLDVDGKICSAFIIHYIIVYSSILQFLFCYENLVMVFRQCHQPSSTCSS